jgi:quercetin dioxygenase-like cupin family protein
MIPANFEEFSRIHQAQGFDEVLVREWAPGQVLDTHRHPFELKVLVVRGEVLLGCGGEQRRYTAGQGFELAREVPHSEHYGPEGATFWVARRHAPS